MTTADAWFEAYDDSPKNSTNKLIHSICVPVIFLSTIGLPWSIPGNFFGNPWPNWTTMEVVLRLAFYLRLSFTLFVGRAVISGLSVERSYPIGLACRNGPAGSRFRLSVSAPSPMQTTSNKRIVRLTAHNNRQLILEGISAIPNDEEDRISRLSKAG